jgi:radical SAM protein with 4Fe4S-binding SPASM domain
MNDIVLIDKKKSHYYYYFNKSNGLSIRSEYNGFDEPFWAVEGPELLDVSITNYCARGCSFCYRDSSIYGKHMSMKNFEKILEYMKETNTYQIALGGGNPNQHPNFIEMLKLCRGKYEIVPSYTTNGDGLTNEILMASKKYCGAVAISYYEPFNKFIEALQSLIQFGIKTNIHFLLTSNTINIAIDWLRNPPEFLTGINAIIFLNYKPVGLNASNSLLLRNSNSIKEFFALVNKHDIRKFKIGFDSCTVSGIVENLNFNPNFIESCEAGRFSAFISENMRLYPCSFMMGVSEGEDLSIISLKEAWINSAGFTTMRNRINVNACKDNCKYEEYCKGSCPIFSEIAICNYSSK